MSIEIEKEIEKETQLRSVASSAMRFSIGTLFSRITGMLREQTMAFFFGTSPFIAAFLIATRFALMLRRLLGEGALLTGFIPQFEAKRVEGEEKANDFFQKTHSSLSWFLIFLLLIVECGLFCLWKTEIFSRENREIILMMMMILPSLFFVCLYALCSALLQCRKNFFLPATAPAIFNLTSVAFVIWIGSSWNKYVIIGLAVSTLIAYILQWALLVPLSYRAFREFFRSFRWNEKFLELGGLLKSVSLTALGLGSVQINGFLDTLFARHASLEGPTYLYYAMRLNQLPLALIGVAISSALLPSLSKAFKEQNLAHFQSLLSFCLQRVFTLIIPCTFAIFALGLPAVVLVYYRGAFHEGSVLHTTLSLWGFGAGLLPMTVVLLLNQGFYAMQEYRIPTRAAIFSVLCNLLLNMLFIWVLRLGAESVSIATSFAALFNVAFLLRKLVPHFRSFFCRETALLVLKLVAASLCAASATLWIGRYFLSDGAWEILSQTAVCLPTSVGRQLLHFFAMFFLFAFFFFIAAHLLQLQKNFSFIRFLRKKKRPELKEE